MLVVENAPWEPTELAQYVSRLMTLGVTRA
jgi:hypothetical protein